MGYGVDVTSHFVGREGGRFVDMCAASADIRNEKQWPNHSGSHHTHFLNFVKSSRFSHGAILWQPEVYDVVISLPNNSLDWQLCFLNWILAAFKTIFA